MLKSKFEKVKICVAYLNYLFFIEFQIKGITYNMEALSQVFPNDTYTSAFYEKVLNMIYFKF